MNAARDPLDEANGAFAVGYAKALAATAMPPPLTERIARLESLLVTQLTRALQDGGLWQRCGVRQVLSIGSTARGTFTDARVDYDLMVETTMPQAQLPTAALRETFAGLAAELARLPELQAHAGGAMTLALSSLGQRGAASLVARFEWQMGEQHGHLLDVTLGDSPRPVNYSRAVSAYLDALAPAHAERLRREIRLAKLCLRQLGEVYGSAEIGLRPMTIEQLVIQSPRLRDPGGRHGSFDDVLLWIAEQGTWHPDAASTVVEDFQVFKRRFPLWRPGVSQDVPETDAAGSRINLFDLLANNQPVPAQEKWSRLATLALVHQALRQQRADWSVDGVVTQAQQAWRVCCYTDAGGRPRRMVFS